MKVLVQTGKSPSISEVSRQIAYVVEQRGHIAILNRGLPSYYDWKKVCDALILVYPVSPVWSISHFLHYYNAKKQLQGRVLFYTTCDGVPKRYQFADWCFREVQLVANSNFTRKCLERCGFKVIDVVHHGVLTEELKLAQYKVNEYKRIIQKRFGDRIVFGVVSDDNPRKGIDKLLNALRILQQKRDDYVVLLVSKKNVVAKLKDVKNVYLTAEFGSRQHFEILGFMGACHFTIFPSLCEGFGLPVLESMSMKTPVIHAWFEPLTEFSIKDGNITIDIIGEYEYDSQEGIFYIMHEYDEVELANAIDSAIDIVKKYKSQYEDMQIKVYEQAMKFKSEDLYSKLLDMIGL